ncbi:hypothetical protein PtA15_1A823 [Puccinia triticina]|uniref:Uncharacterized protein n=1 Tax=Puccinia triticina TaxID=208348 RepID=A0ABY7C8H6_9BASI|nr:uncharacterized protein PtA15_1A823 [Puccinia triticina]WAQ81481.1 hypothetical protein PtA15_1A823 [Puccinia triticina]WAR52363.1 hypothetical protein PtB15_1B804 [Puccinia triticina]
MCLSIAAKSSTLSATTPHPHPALFAHTPKPQSPLTPHSVGVCTHPQVPIASCPKFRSSVYQPRDGLPTLCSANKSGGHPHAQPRIPQR